MEKPYFDESIKELVVPKLCKYCIYYEKIIKENNTRSGVCTNERNCWRYRNMPILITHDDETCWCWENGYFKGIDYED